MSDPRDIPMSAMTLRDYFASQAMREIAALEMSLEGDSEDETLTTIAHESYRMADAMLAERAK